MICQRCLRYLRTGEGLKCDTCASGFHMKCVSECPRDLAESGDRLYHWKCAVCHKAASKATLDFASNPRENLINAINIITEKFEVVNKIQLPKINSDLIQVKSITEHIVKQNENILRKMCELEHKKKNIDNRPGYSGGSPRGYRTRSVNVTSKTKDEMCKECDHVPVLPLNEKHGARYRTRRPYILNRMFRLLNRNRNLKTRTPRKNYKT